MKLTKSQVKEFSKSAISPEYAALNFMNVNKRKAKELISESTYKAYHVPPSGWSDLEYRFIKPNVPRVKDGKVVKYENVNGAPILIQIVHPEGTILKSGTNFVEGLKKAVSVAQHTKQVTYHFPGLGGGINLANQMLAIDPQATIYIDNDLSTSARQNARLLLSKAPTCKVASFTGYKGIDDLLASGGDYKLVSSENWLNSYAGHTGTTFYCNEKYLPATVNYPNLTKILALISPKGSGKTTLMRNIAAQKMLQGKPALYVTHRVALGRDAAKRLGITYIDKDSSEIQTSVSLCVDSIRAIAVTPALNGAVIYLDEFTQLWHHILTSDTLNGKRGEVLAHFIKILQYVSENGGIIVAADADLDEQHISYLTAIINDSTNVFTVFNSFVQDNGTATFYYGAAGSTKTTRGFDLIDILIEHIKAGKRCYVSLSGTDASSLCGTKNLFDYLSTFTDSIIEINAANTSNPEHPAFKAVERINDIVSIYQVILASPTLGTGVDITASVDGVYCIHSGLGSINDVAQSLARVRNFSVPRYIFVPAVHAMNSTYASKFTDVNSIVNYCQSAIASNPYAHLSRDSITTLSYELSNKYLAASNNKLKNEQANYRQLLIKKIASEGYKIVLPNNEIVAIYPEHETALDGYRTTNVDIEDNLLIAAPLIDEAEYLELIAKKSSNPSDSAKIEKFNFYRNNGIEINSEILKLKKDNYFVNAKRGYLAENFELAEALTERSLSFETSKNYISTDLIRIKSRFEAIKSFNASGLADVSIIKPSEIDGFTANLALATDVFGTTPEDISLPIVLKSFGKVVTSRRMRDGDSRRNGYEVSDDTSVIYQQLKAFWREKDEPKVKSFREYQSTQAQRVVAAQQDAGLILKGEPLDMVYTNLSTRSRSLLGAIKSCYYRIATSENITELKQFILATRHIAIDVETAANDTTNKMGGLDYLEGHIELLQMCDGTTTWLVTKKFLTDIKDEMCTMLCSREVHKFGHNFAFDSRFLRATFDVKLRNTGCSLIAAKCLMGDYGAAKVIKYSLKSIVENFLGLILDKTEQKSDWSKELTESQLQYAANDAYYTYLVYQQLSILLVKPSIIGLNIPDNICAEMYSVEQKFLDVQQAIEETGYEIDQASVAQCVSERTMRLAELMVQWELLMPGVTPNQVKVICTVLSERYGIDINSVSRKAIYDIEIPEIRIRKQIDAVNRDLDLLNTINGESSIKPIITSLSGTGRTSVGNRRVNKKFLALHGIAARTNPAIPKDWNFTSVRSCFKVGQIIDLPASHAHISANLSGDVAALAALSDDSIDNHCVVATSVAKAIGLDTDIYTADYIKMNKKSGICKQLRDTAKNTFYGWLNGAGVATVKMQIQANLGLSVTSDAAGIALNGLKNLFAGITEYSQNKIEELRQQTSIVNGQIIGHMVVNNQLISWVVGKTGESPNPSPTKATGAIWSRIEATLTKRAGIRILDSIELDGLSGSILGYNHDDYNLDGCDEFKLNCFDIMRDEFTKATLLTGFGAFGNYKATIIDASGKPITKWSQK